MPLFYELSFLFACAGFFALVAQRLKQPTIVGYLVAGIVSGPHVFGLINSTHELELFAKIGVIFLLFAVGLHLNPTILKQTGLSAILAGSGQVTFTSLAGFFVMKLFGYSNLESIYIAIAMTFSSTIVAVKIFTDKKDLGKLYAKISVGILLVQDLIATIILLAISMGASSGALDPYSTALEMIVKICSLLALLLIGGGWLMPWMLRFSAKEGEVLFLFSVGWGIGVASIFSKLGLSVEIGALLAGVAISTSGYVDEISSRLKPVRDIFLALFFVILGSQIDLGDLSKLLPLSLVLSAFVLVGNPIIMWGILRLMKHTNKVGMLTGFSMAQISEFSLILTSLGISMGHIGKQEASLVAIVALITISLSSYLMHYNEIIFEKIRPFLDKVFPRKNEVETKERQEKIGAILFGHDRVGADFCRSFEKMRLKYLVVDYNPERVEELKKNGINVIYGDGDDVEFLETLPTANLKIVVSTVPGFETNLLLSRYFSKKEITFVGLAHSKKQTVELYKNLASYVIMPHYLGARYAARLIAKARVNKVLYKRLKTRHLARLNAIE